MTQEEKENQDALDPEGEEETLDPQEDEQEAEESDKDNEARLKKAEEYANNQKIRAEKAEKELKSFREKKPEQADKKFSLSHTDIIAAVKSDLEDEDIETVNDYAALKNISFKEALSSNVIKSVIAERKEERKTAEASSTGNKRSGSRSKSGEDLLQEARSGKAVSDGDVSKLVDARFQSKIKR